MNNNKNFNLKLLNNNKTFDAIQYLEVYLFKKQYFSYFLELDLYIV